MIMRLALLALAIAAAPALAADDYPNKPIRVIVPYEPASTTPEEFRALIESDLGPGGRVVKEAGITVQ